MWWYHNRENDWIFWMVIMGLMAGLMCRQYKIDKAAGHEHPRTMIAETGRDAYTLGFMTGACWAMHPSTTTAREALRAGMIDSWRELDIKDNKTEETHK